MTVYLQRVVIPIVLCDHEGGKSVILSNNSFDYYMFSMVLFMKGTFSIAMNKYIIVYYLYD